MADTSLRLHVGLSLCSLFHLPHRPVGTKPLDPEKVGACCRSWEKGKGALLPELLFLVKLSPTLNIK